MFVTISLNWITWKYRKKGVAAKQNDGLCKNNSALVNFNKAESLFVVIFVSWLISVLTSLRGGAARDVPPALHVVISSKVIQMESCAPLLNIS